jgi:hypothetical protein
MIFTTYKRNSVIQFLIAISATILTACNQDEDRYEVINKLRAIGVEANPFVTALSPIGSPETATLTFLAAVPLAHTVKAEVFVDGNSAFSKTLPITIVAGSEAYVEREKFRIFSVKATMPIPEEGSVPIPSFPGYVTFRYGMKLTADDAEEEKVVGNIVVFSSQKDELKWKDTPPTVQINSLIAGQTVSGIINLKGEVLSSNGEKFKISWFVSSGEVKNKRAVETTWDKVEKGPQTIILTARGKTTAAFAWTALDIVVE